MSVSHSIAANRPWRTATLAGMASFLDAAALVSSGTAISVLYAPTFHLSPAEIGLVLACQQSSFAVGAMFGGRLGDRLGRRRVLSVALLGFAIGAAILGLATATWMLYVGAIFAGLSIGADLPVALAMANEAAPVSKKGRMVVFSQLLWTLGIAFVQLMVSFVGHMGATGARILFGSLVVLAILVLVARFALPESPEWTAARNAADSGETDVIKFDHLGQIFRRPVVFAVLALAIYYTTWNVGASINGKYATYIWTKLAGGGVEAFARLSLLSLPLTFGATVLFMAVVDKKSRKLFTGLGTILVLLGWAPLAFFGASQPAMLAVVFLFNIGSCFAGEPLFKVWSQELVPTLLRGTSQGATIAVARVVAAILAFIVPTILAVNPAPVFIGILVCALISAAVWGFWIPRLPKAQELEKPALLVVEAGAVDEAVAGW